MNSGLSGVSMRAVLMQALPLLVVAAAGVVVAVYLLFDAQWLSVPSMLAVLTIGAALVAAVNRQVRLSVALAIPAIGAGTFALAFQIRRGWMAGEIMALSGLLAVAVVLAAFALLLTAWVRAPRFRTMSMLSIGGIICMLAVTGLVSDLLPGALREQPPVTGTLWRGGLVLGIGLSLIGLIMGRAREAGRAVIRRWLFIPLALAFIVGTLVLSHLLRMQEINAIERSTEITLSRVVNQVQSILDGSVVGLDRMAQSWAWRGAPDQNDWNTDAWLFVSHYDEVDVVAWIDAEFRVQWLTPLAGNEEMQGEYLGFDPTAWEAVQRAFETREVAVSQPMPLLVGGEWGFHVYAPIRGATRGVDGYIGGAYRLEPLIDAAVETVAPGYVIRLVNRETAIYRSANDDLVDESRWQATATMEPYGASWTLTAMPRSDAVARQLSPLPAVTLVFGLLMAMLASLAVYQAEVNRTAAGRLVREVRRRAHTEAALRRSRHDLELRVAARTADLNQKQRELEQINARLEEMATTDSLTGLANRRHFLDLAEQAFRGAGRYDRLVSLIMLDLDDFKDINDTHGHQVGDNVLQAVAETCSVELRDSDVFSRYGGEEFVVLLLETGETAARQVAERLRENIEALDVRHEDERLVITASLGVTQRRAEDRNIEDMLLRADEAMYEAKDSGRNRVIRGTDA